MKSTQRYKARIFVNDDAAEEFCDFLNDKNPECYASWDELQDGTYVVRWIEYEF
jgi:hypothetical protein